VEPGEHPRETVRREIHEELGFMPAESIAAPLMITITDTVGVTAGHTDVSLWYVVPAARSQAMVFDRHEFVDCRWFEFDEAPFDRADPHLARFISKLRARQGAAHALAATVVLRQP
jgi:ADP-ribose pyrophosphatase YjhB (NUDIX family)